MINYKNRIMQKTIFILIIFIAMILSFSCSKENEKVKNPKLKYEAFKSIGTDGLKKGVTLTELQSEYKGHAWFLESNGDNLGEEMNCTGFIEGSDLVLEIELAEGNIVLDEIPAFILDESIITAPEIKGTYLPNEEDLTLICGVKIYPSGHLINGVLKYMLQDEQEFSTIYFSINNVE